LDFEYSYIPSSGVELNALIDSLTDATLTVEPVYLDIETTTLDEFTGTIVLIQVYYNSKIHVVNAIDSDSKDLKRLVDALSYHTCIGHNIKFELKYILEKYGVLFKNVYDTQTTEAVLRAGVGKSLYSLSELVEKYCLQFLDKSARDEFINFTGCDKKELL
jgi:ribonuclease D